MTHNLTTQLTALLKETGAAHHHAFIETDGADPDWPIWYAEYLVDKVPALLGSTPTRSKLVHLLMQLEEARLAESPEADWAEFYAERLGRFATSGGASRPGAAPGITGLGGIFFKAQDPGALKAWYQRHLGMVVQDDGNVMFEWAQADDPDRKGFTVWGPFKDDTSYFDPSDKPYMFNFRVDDLDGLLEALRGAGVAVDDSVEDYPYGRFGWCMDPEGNRIELWEPK